MGRGGRLERLPESGNRVATDAAGEFRIQTGGSSLVLQKRLDFSPSVRLQEEKTECNQVVIKSGNLSSPGEVVYLHQHLISGGVSWFHGLNYDELVI